MVCRNGRRSQEIWECQDLCRTEATQPQRTEESPPTPQGGSDTGTISRSQSDLETRCEQRILADPPLADLMPFDHVHHANGTLLLQQAPFRHLERSRTLPTEDERAPHWPRGSSVPYGRCSHLRQGRSRTPRESGSSPEAAGATLNPSK